MTNNTSFWNKNNLSPEGPVLARELRADEVVEFPDQQSVVELVSNSYTIPARWAE